MVAPNVVQRWVGALPGRRAYDEPSRRAGSVGAKYLHGGRGHGQRCLTQSDDPDRPGRLYR
jgi:hypothetical protein